MRTNDLLEQPVASGGDVAPSRLHLGRWLRAVAFTGDLAGPAAARGGTLDGSIIRIEAGTHGVRVSHHPSAGMP